MTIITLHHLFFGHCVNLLVLVLDLGIFFNTSVENNHLQFHTMTSKKMVCSYYCLINEAKFLGINLDSNLR